MARLVCNQRYYLASGSAERDCPAHRTKHEVWWSSRRAIDQWLPSLDPPLCPGAVLVRPDYRCIHHDKLKVRIVRQGFEKTLPNAFAGPTIIPLKNTVPLTTGLRRCRLHFPAVHASDCQYVPPRAPHQQTCDCLRLFCLHRSFCLAEGL
jgi:hypothetical protein